jgi:hypothetical protein
MAEKSGFFNAMKIEDGIYDREYDAEQFAEYFANFVSNGVYVNPTNQLKVVFNGSPSKPFVVVVRKGKAYIDGYWYELTDDKEVTISANTKSYAIKDVICCTLDKTERKISIILKEDVISDMPVNNDIQHDLVLSTILVQPNASKLNAEDITDKRPDKTYCGFVTGLIDQIDTTELFQQYDDAFQEWFNEMKDQLTEDAAGNIQKQIGNLLDLKTSNKTSLVAAINEVIMNATHPIGSVYLSFNPTDPSELFGGTWDGITGTTSENSAPRFLYVTNPNSHSEIKAGTVGGSDKVKLTTAELPSHEHSIEQLDGSTVSVWASNAGQGTIWNVVANGAISSPGNTLVAKSVGSGKEFSIVPPYTVVYGWKRIA